MSATETARQMAVLAAQGAADKQGQNIVVIDVSDRLAITDCFVIASGANDRQVGAIVDAVEDKLRDAGHKPARREGQRDGRWVLLDYVDVVVHVQHTEERVFYALERLWKDCPTFTFTDDPGQPTMTAADLVGPGGATPPGPVESTEPEAGEIGEPGEAGDVPSVDEVPLGHS
jgi:ribosome-associated protein